jgi:hypothetical protein
VQASTLSTAATHVSDAAELPVSPSSTTSNANGCSNRSARRSSRTSAPLNSDSVRMGRDPVASSGRTGTSSGSVRDADGTRATVGAVAPGISPLAVQSMRRCHDHRRAGSVRGAAALPHGVTANADTHRLRMFS